MPAFLVSVGHSRDLVVVTSKPTWFEVVLNVMSAVLCKNQDTSELKSW